jgi:hypothetical protein
MAKADSRGVANMVFVAETTRTAEAGIVSGRRFFILPRAGGVSIFLVGAWAEAGET